MKDIPGEIVILSLSFKLTRLCTASPGQIGFIAFIVSTVTTMTAVSSDDHYELRHPRLPAAFQSTTDRPVMKDTALLTTFQNYILAWRRGGAGRDSGGENYT